MIFVYKKGCIFFWDITQIRLTAFYPLGKFLCEKPARYFQLPDVDFGSTFTGGPRAFFRTECLVGF